jgi:hypothetical protein
MVFKDYTLYLFKHIICVSGNGSLINNKYYKEDISGYLIVPVNVTDAAGSDTVNVKVRMFKVFSDFFC